eukprot:bmy_00923T0
MHTYALEYNARIQIIFTIEHEIQGTRSLFCSRFETPAGGGCRPLLILIRQRRSVGSSRSLIAQVTPAPPPSVPSARPSPTHTCCVLAESAQGPPRARGERQGGQQSAQSAVTSPRPDQESNPSPSTPPPSQNMHIQVEDIRIRAILSAYRKRTPVTEGYVEVKEGKTWKQICDRHWTAKNSRVVCGMFGFPGEKSYNAKVYK